MLRVDLHTHTNSSWDGWMTPAELVRNARAAGLDRVAVTDHNAIDGALRARDLDPQLVIVGEEIRCRCGTELIGLFLERHIPPGLPMEEVAARIRDQGGLVYAPHPYAYLSRAADRAERALSVADIIEVHNGRAFWPAWNRRATRTARDRRLVLAASSDAHLPGECGRAWTEITGFSSPDGLLRGLASGTLRTGRTASPIHHAATLAIGLLRLTRSAAFSRFASSRAVRTGHP